MARKVKLDKMMEIIAETILEELDAPDSDAIPSEKSAGINEKLLEKLIQEELQGFLFNKK